LLVKRRVEAAKKGELPVNTPEAATTVVTAAEIGQLAPDFLAVEVGSTKTTQLRKWLGRPILLVFYHPASPTGTEMLTFCERLAATYPQGVSVITLAMSDDAELVRKQRADLNLTVPAISGVGLRISYNVEATPKLVLLDGQEIVRGMWTGWGPQTPHEVLEELKHWLPRK
jgi:peroxiredoxin